MFNLINKTVQSVKELQKPIATVEEIHREFDSASERILEEANAILEKESSKDKEEIRKLKELGFIKLNSVKELEEEEEKKAEATKNAELISYYKKQYPNNKFISKTEVERICKKYGLIMGSSSDYIGEIPPKNRKEIIEFKLKDKKDYADYTTDGIILFALEYGITGLEYKSTSLQIIATPDQFDLKDKIISNYRIIAKDPIVLHPVNGGYLIVSKWGNEENLNEFK